MLFESSPSHHPRDQLAADDKNPTKNAPVSGVRSMIKATIFTVADGKLTAMRQSSPESEDSMQRLIALYPEIIAGDDGPLLLIQREHPIADSLTGVGRWSLDHLFVSRAGVPVLAELKRATDTRLRREVVGQLLDYAANAAAYWQPGTLAAAFAKTARAAGINPDQALSEFLGDKTPFDDFWQRVDDSIMAGHMKLVFVADTVPPELARVVEFLNEQMKAKVLAVELNWYEGEGMRAFVPRLIGETQRTRAAKAANQGLISTERWIEERVAPLGPEAVSAAENFMAAALEAGGETYVPLSQGSMRIRLTDKLAGKSIFPLGLTASDKVTAQLNLASLSESSAFSTEESRADLYQRLKDIVGDLSTTNLKGYPAFDALLINNPELCSRLQRLLRYMADLHAQEMPPYPGVAESQSAPMASSAEHGQ